MRKLRENTGGNTPSEAKRTAQDDKDREEAVKAIWRSPLQLMRTRENKAGSKKSRGSKMIEIGRVCVKTAGRDAGKKCIIIDVLDENFAVIDGYTRRRKVNIRHLEPLSQVTKVDKNAGHEEIVEELEKLGMKEKKKKPARKEKPKEEKKPAAKKAAKKK